MSMRKLFLIAASALLLFSCEKKTDYTVYNGQYTVDSGTVITVNGHEVSLSDYESAMIAINVISDNECEITLSGFINGQPEVKIPAILTTDDNTKSAAGAAFSGETSIDDRTVSIEGLTGESSIAAISINENITVPGIPGKWTLSNVTLAFSHPDLETIDLSGLIPGMSGPEIRTADIVAALNEMINSIISSDESLQESYVELTADGYLRTGSTNPDVSESEINDIIAYYIRPENKILNLYMPKSVTTILFSAISTTYGDLVAALQLKEFFDNPQSITVPLIYETGDGKLTLTADQSIVSPYIPMLTGAIDILKAYISSMDAETVKHIASILSPEFAVMINETNYTIMTEALKELIDAFISTEAAYSVSFGLTAVE